MKSEDHLQMKGVVPLARTFKFRSVVLFSLSWSLRLFAALHQQEMTNDPSASATQFRFSFSLITVFSGFLGMAISGYFPPKETHAG
jgi:hypothetical protein